MKTLQDRLKYARKEALLTQKELSSASGLSQSTIAQIESGRNSGTRFADKLADALNVSVNWLLTGLGPMSDEPLVQHPRRRAMDADEWLFLDLVEPQVNTETNEIEWTCLERGGLRIHRSFFRGTSTVPEDCRVLVAKDESMSPFLFAGDWFVIDTTRNTFVEGPVAFIRGTNDHYVSRVRKLPDGGIRLIETALGQQTFDFPPGVAEQKLRPLGVVIFHTTAPTYEYQLK